ncbi:MAG: bifunctional riboflavin kinase/FAD synthetase [Oscillospiraceae bacterium]
MAFSSDFENGCVIALGNFDGLHSGHRAVINSAIEISKQLNCTPCILMFKEHSLKLLRGKAPSELFSGEIKQRLFEETKLSIRTIDFSEIKNMGAQEFFEEILINKFNAKAVCCGYNYHFGKIASGDTKKLEELCKNAGLVLSVAPPTEYKGEPVSSTRIRKALEAGEIESVNAMLQRTFSYKAVVIDGDKRGRILGTPTINQVIDEKMTMPKHGVYASQTIIDGKYYASVTNIGIRPTIGTGVLGSETYIIGFSGDLYGRSIEVGLLKFLRGEQKFESLDALVNQIEKDAIKAKKIFESHNIGK